MSWSGCSLLQRKVLVVSAEQVETFVKKGEPAPDDGVFMNEARYQRYRRAVADKIQQATVQGPKSKVGNTP